MGTEKPGVSFSTPKSRDSGDKGWWKRGEGSSATPLFLLTTSPHSRSLPSSRGKSWCCLVMARSRVGAGFPLERGYGGRGAKRRGSPQLANPELGLLPSALQRLLRDGSDRVHGQLPCPGCARHRPDGHCRGGQGAAGAEAGPGAVSRPAPDPAGRRRVRALGARLRPPAPAPPAAAPPAPAPPRPPDTHSSVRFSAAGRRRRLCRAPGREQRSPEGP